MNEQVEKTFWFCVLFLFLRQCITAVKRDATFLTLLTRYTGMKAGA